MTRNSVTAASALLLGLLLVPAPADCTPLLGFWGKRRQGGGRHREAAEHHKREHRQEKKGGPDADGPIGKKEEIREKLREKGEARIDARQANQAKRIDHGIKKGYLTDEEVAKLQKQQSEIARLEETALADNKLTRDEWTAIRDALNEASRCIWAEKHDTEGAQMAVYRLGKNVFAKSDLTSKLADENLSSDEAKALLKDFRRLVELKRRLATEDLSDAERAALQSEYNELLNRYFETR